MYHGVINVYKEPGFTSHDVVAKLRGILKQKKIGHTGTLDPAAEGVLPVCLGQGTRLADMLADKGKTYEAVLLLGQETDTQDTTGQITARYPVEATEQEIYRAAASFVGEQEQVPPMYSALKVNGKKLYELARAGKEVRRQSRKICISELTVDWIKLPRVGITVTCSKGTYIRTLCEDLGKVLGCGGCMEHLKRTRVERFLCQDSLTLSQIERLRDQGKVEEMIIPIEKMFDGPKAIAAECKDKRVRNGNPAAEEDFAFLIIEDEKGEIQEIYSADKSGLAKTWGKKVSLHNVNRIELPRTGLIRVYDSRLEFLGVYEYDKEYRWWKPKKMFRVSPIPVCAEKHAQNGGNDELYRTNPGVSD